jgi:hypothetical protein
VVLLLWPFDLGNAGDVLFLLPGMSGLISFVVFRSILLSFLMIVLLLYLKKRVKV